MHAITNASDFASRRCNASASMRSTWS
ncbi:hypothetical protein LCGC14_2795500, partial [marine sediment metagenome]